LNKFELLDCLFKLRFNLLQVTIYFILLAFWSPIISVGYAAYWITTILYMYYFAKTETKQVKTIEKRKRTGKTKG
jgi:hypothetical protein